VARTLLIEGVMMRKGSLWRTVGVFAVALVGSAWGCASSASNQPSAAFASSAPYLESDIPPANRPTPRAEVVSFEGADVGHARREFSAAAHGLRACPNDGRVPVRIRVRKETDGRTEIAFADTVPPFSPEGRRCILDAMSTVNVEDIASGGSPSNRPLGFTANILLSW
jgi:hypothetical protein